MIIDTTTYKLSNSNFIEEETIKKQIMIGHTGTHNMNHFTKWVNRLNGTYKKTAAFTIDLSGNVYQHFDPIYFSPILDNLDMDKKSIVILLENDGWLVKDTEKNHFINWIGNIYNKPDDIIERKWRGYSYWVPYTIKQMESAVLLANKICEEFFIDKFAIPHNIKLDTLDDFKGVLYRSNIEKYYTDLSPAWNCELFKSKLETI